MIEQYKDYLESKNILDFEEAVKIHGMMAEEIGDDEDAVDLYDELVQKAIDYSKFRASWPMMSIDEKAEKDSSRTACHDSLIVKFNQLARYLKMNGKEASWRDELGYEEDDKINRKRIGDMGCFIVYINGLNGR